MTCPPHHPPQAALLKTQREAAALEEAVESPANEGRYRLLRGKIPDQEELLAKLQVGAGGGGAGGEVCPHEFTHETQLSFEQHPRPASP
jgi:hypothetical protein